MSEASDQHWLKDKGRTDAPLTEKGDQDLLHGRMSDQSHSRHRFGSLRRYGQQRAAFRDFRVNIRRIADLVGLYRDICARRCISSVRVVPERPRLTSSKQNQMSSTPATHKVAVTAQGSKKGRCWNNLIREIHVPGYWVTGSESVAPRTYVVRKAMSFVQSL
jgi:hypothetical protein